MFKIDDKVKILHAVHDGHSVGDFRTVTRVDPKGDWISVEGLIYFKEEIELAEGRR